VIDGPLVVKRSLRSGNLLRTGAKVLSCQFCMRDVSLADWAGEAVGPGCGPPVELAISIDLCGMCGGRSDFEPPGQRVAQGQFVGVFEVAAGWQATREAGHANAKRFDKPGDVHCGRLSFQVGVCGNEQFCGEDVVRESAGMIWTQAANQFFELEVIRADALDGRDCAVEDVVEAAKCAGALDGLHVEGLLDDTDYRLVALAVFAKGARVSVGDIVADGAEKGLRFQLLQGGRECLGDFIVAAEEKVGQAGGRFRPYAGESAEGVDQVGDRLCEGHGAYLQAQARDVQSGG